jgi:hypothetical protein
MQAGRKKPDRLKNMLADAEQQLQKKLLEMERLLRTNVSVPQTTNSNSNSSTPQGVWVTHCSAHETAAQRQLVVSCIAPNLWDVCTG